MTFIECLDLLRKNKGSLGKRLGWNEEMYIYYVKSTLLKSPEQCTQFQLRKIMEKNKKPLTVNDRFDLIECENGIIRLNRLYYISSDVYANDWVIILPDDNIITGEDT